MIDFSLAEICQILAVNTSVPALNIHGLSTDTRTLSPGNLFVAIKGENFDGHQFVAQAHKAGACAALVSHKIDCPLPQIEVADTIQAFGKLTKAWRDKFTLPIIGVTGSNGKTTLKNMIANILRAACNEDKNKVLATEGNLNNEIGLPLNLARLSSQHQLAVIEMGMNRPGEIAYLTRLAQPTVAVINNAAAAHLAGLNNVEGVAKAKGEIFLGLAENGAGVLNADDQFLPLWKGLLTGRRCITFGLKNPADVSAELPTTARNSNQQTITLKTPQGNIDVQLKLFGTHNVMNALAACAACLAVNLDLATIKRGLEHVEAVPGRLQLFTTPNGVRVINDTYNANPASLQAAIHVLAELSGPKILVLGDMRELGTDEKQLHITAGKNAQAAGIDYLFTVGDLSAEAAKAFGNNAQSFANKTQLLTALRPHLQTGVNVLVKGSRSMRMEEVVAGLLPENVFHKEAH